MSDGEYTLQTRNGYALIVEYDRGPHKEPVILQYDVRGLSRNSEGKFRHLCEAVGRFDEMTLLAQTVFHDEGRTDTDWRVRAQSCCPG